MALKASTETAKRLGADHTQATVDQTDISLPWSLKESKGGVAQAMEDLARAQRVLRADFPGADWPQAKFALDQLAVLAVQYKNCLRAERLLFRSEIKILCPASIARLHRCSNLFMNLRRCRKEIQEEFKKISGVLLRNRIRRETNQRLPTPDLSTRTRDSDQKRGGAMTADHRAPNSDYAPPPDRAASAADY